MLRRRAPDQASGFLFSASDQKIAGSAIAGRHRASANRLIDPAMNRLEYLCDSIGNRISGTAAPDQAVNWCSDQITGAGLGNVRTIAVKVLHGVLSRQSAEMPERVYRRLFMAWPANSVATPPDGITAEVFAVSTFAEREKAARVFTLRCAFHDVWRDRSVPHDRRFACGPSRSHRRAGPFRLAGRPTRLSSRYNIEPDDFRRRMVAMGAMSYILPEWPQRA